MPPSAMRMGVSWNEKDCPSLNVRVVFIVGVKEVVVICNGVSGIGEAFEIVTPVGGASVSGNVALLDGSALLTAWMIIWVDAGSAEGAVYVAAALPVIVPTVALPPAIPLTLQVTEVSGFPLELTVAVSPRVAPRAIKEVPAGVA